MGREMRDDLDVDTGHELLHDGFDTIEEAGAGILCSWKWPSLLSG
jgi:hypothetical protein